MDPSPRLLSPGPQVPSFPSRPPKTLLGRAPVFKSESSFSSPSEMEVVVITFYVNSSLPLTQSAVTQSAVTQSAVTHSLLSHSLLSHSLLSHSLLSHSLLPCSRGGRGPCLWQRDPPHLNFQSSRRKDVCVCVYGSINVFLCAGFRC